MGAERDALVRLRKHAGDGVTVQPGGIFQDGDRWLAVGDSITQNGTYSLWVYLYYLTRFPHWSFHLFNAGISGDSAEGAIRRYDWDLRGFGSTVATIMFGMNDVCRELYEGTASSPETARLREMKLREFGGHMIDLAVRLKKDGARVVFVTPSIYGESMPDDGELGVNGALAKCGDIMGSMAGFLSAEFIDLHGPMMEIARKMRRTDGGPSLVGSDRVHPTPLGNFIMAYLLLKGGQASAKVSEVDLDAEEFRVNKVENASVENLSFGAETVGFSVEAMALPYPVGEEAQPALDWVPFHEDLNCELLRVRGLRAGRHLLVVDGEEIGLFDAAELSAGVNLAPINVTPQARQSAEILRLVRQWHALLCQDLRVLAQTEHWHLADIPRSATDEEARAVLQKELKRLNGSLADIDQYNRRIMEQYLLAKPREAETRECLEDLLVEIRRAARPKSRRYELYALHAI